jgi:hypothetical protein
MYLPYSMQNVMYEQQLSDAACATGRRGPAGSRRPARASRAHAARRLTRHVRSAKPRAARLPWPAPPAPAPRRGPLDEEDP